jgi:hypothetical protein
MSVSKKRRAKALRAFVERLIGERNASLCRCRYCLTLCREQVRR